VGKPVRHRPEQRKEGPMADNSPIEFKAHEQTYDKFIKAFTYGAVACFVIAAIVIYLIAS